jgi:hypothetical protein
VSSSPIEQLLASFDSLDVEAALALFAPDGRLLTVDGRRAVGTDQIKQLIESFLSQLRSTTHRITSLWQEADVWIAECQGSYELKDDLLIRDLPRAVIARVGPDGLRDVRVYGAHERELSEHHIDTGMWVGGRWVPPL